MYKRQTETESESIKFAIKNYSVKKKKNYSVEGCMINGQES